jgi:hypothetical protein
LARWHESGGAICQMLMTVSTLDPFWVGTVELSEKSAPGGKFK